MFASVFYSLLEFFFFFCNFEQFNRHLVSFFQNDCETYFVYGLCILYCIIIKLYVKINSKRLRQNYRFERHSTLLVGSSTIDLLVRACFHYKNSIVFIDLTFSSIDYDVLGLLKMGQKCSPWYNQGRYIMHCKLTQALLLRFRSS